MIEIIAMTPEDARRIEACGADRIELVGALSEGGLTPSYGMIEKVVQAVRIPVNVMIRPHAKSFLYKEEEIGIMKKDILVSEELGANGVVFGALDETGQVSEEIILELTGICGGLDITFHKAIDESTDVIEGIAILSRHPWIKTVLTSGGRGSIADNIPVINKMIERSGHIRVMTGGGLNLANIRQVMEGTGLCDYHFGTAVRFDHSIHGDIDAKKLKELIGIIKSGS